MNHNLLKEQLFELKVIMPIMSEEGGNYTELYFDQSCEEEACLRLKKKCSTVISHIAQNIYFDISSFRREYSETFNRKTGMPLALHPGLVLIPLKVREAEYKDQGTVCYVNIIKIKYMKMIDASKTAIIFHDDMQIDVLQSLDSVVKLKNIASMIRYHHFESYKKYLH